jgi:hypothetical protein
MSTITRIAGEVTIESPITVVFDTVADERNELLYNRRIARAEKVTDGAVGAGTRFTVEPKGIGTSGAMAVEIMEYDRPHRLRNTISSSAMQVDGFLHFEETPHGTRLWWVWHIQLRDPPPTSWPRAPRPPEIAGSLGRRGSSKPTGCLMSHAAPSRSRIAQDNAEADRDGRQRRHHRTEGSFLGLLVASCS